MKTDYSKQIYDIYFGLENRMIKLVLKNGSIIKGIICGFFKGDTDLDEPYVIKWHIVKEQNYKRFGSNFLGCITGEIIKQEDIHEVYYYENNKEKIIKRVNTTTNEKTSTQHSYIHS